MKRMSIASRLSGAVCVALLLVTPAAVSEETAPESLLLDVMADELAFSMSELATDDGARPYYMAYTITDSASIAITARLGALFGDNADRSRTLDVDLRVGDHGLDNTRQLRGRGFGMDFSRMFGGGTTVPLDDDGEALRQALWQATDTTFKSAVERYQQVVTNTKTMVEEEDPSDDFSHEEPTVHNEESVGLSVDREQWAQRVRSVSAMALEHPAIHTSSVSFNGSAENRLMVSSEGTRLKTGRELLRVIVSAGTKADDGMDLSQSFLFNASSEEGLPSEEEMRAAMRQVMDQVLALADAPLVEPYTGPAILLNRASGVFFHEIFGHRIEGHRQKNVEEGQTFTKMIGEPVLPEFLSVVDDPTAPRHGDEDLRGFYRFDDEGIAAQSVTLVEEGILKTFLLSRSPVAGFDVSNGHGRRQPGRDVVSRQGNLTVLSSHQVPFGQLREMLVEQCKQQDKPFGLLFEDITGGFTTTSRGGPQAFKVQPVVVYKIFADGSPDELVRGVDIVGTPLSCFSKIIATGDDPGVFNGTCGAESGWVPVSAVSPSILVEQIEIEKKERSQERPPLLASPIGIEPDGTEEIDTVLLALRDELARTEQLRLDDIEAPYFVQLRVTDRGSHRMSAAHGALVASTPSRRRSLTADVRAGSYELDNTNFSGGGGFGGFGGRRPGRGGGFGGGTALPVEDDYTAIRQAAWLATDSAYKSAVETLAQKRAYLEGRDAEDRAPDFTPMEAVTVISDKGSLDFGAPDWESRVRRLSARFTNHHHLQDSGVDLSVSAGTDYLVSSEGTKERIPSGRAVLTLRANVQAEDGQPISDRIVHVAETADGLPAEEQLLADVDALASRLATAMAAPPLLDYTGPVLFDGVAAPQLFDALLVRGVGARPAPAGGGRRRAGGDSLEKMVGKRMLPRSFQVWDDPGQADYDGQPLAGHYGHDDDGIAPRRVDLVVDGKLVDMVRSRVPTKEFSGSTGHGRGGRASAGCVYVTSDEGLTRDDLLAALLEAAEDEGLEYALKVSALDDATPTGSQSDLRRMIARMQRGGGGRRADAPADPLLITKVYLDGTEEPVRACEFDALQLNSLKDIVAAGDSPVPWNRVFGAAPASVIAPAVIVEDLDLFAIEEEYEKRPFLPSPIVR